MMEQDVQIAAFIEYMQHQHFATSCSGRHLVTSAVVAETQSVVRDINDSQRVLQFPYLPPIFAHHVRMR